MFRAGIAFNFLNFDTTQKLHEDYLEVANARPKVKLPSYKHMRMVMLDYIYLRIQKQVHPLTACWDEFGCTFITDGSSDRRERPVMNFLAAGEKGADLVTTVSMTARKKTAQALAKLWEQIMREIGVRRINAICTDNAEVNKKAAQILERRTDKDIARIPWVPCAAYCCSLLLRDISKLDWVKSTVKRGHTIVKFIRNHHSTNSLMMFMDDSLTLLRPTEVRFGSVYMMLERLLNRKAVLLDMVDRKNATRWTGIRCAIVQNAMRYLQRQVGGSWKGSDHLDVLGDLHEFHKESTPNGPKRKDKKMWESDAKVDCEKLTPSEWWATYDGDVPDLQAIAIKTVEELVRQSSFMKTPKGRIRKKLEDEEDECSDDSDLDDELWKGKCGLSNETSGANEEEDESDSDFELGAQPLVPGTTYVGMREPAGRQREKPPAVSTQARRESSSRYHPQSDVDTDIELLLQTDPVDEDEAEADRAKALADRDRDVVQKRIMEEDARRAAIPTRREIERRKKKVGEKEPETRRPSDDVQEREEEEQQQVDRY
ncbi:hypothetical protein CBR_g46636 [Chara braunii]|uniref:DUF659 domain-containing protein n=1 Tax=Chara braunii TaxID=69332 RepID=A0A388M0Q1_CHABU|nr:hypothetical protein CBR_g46636 [Chara braunii]|eukprot:GBG88148.1 hypothetical protein CBR_g46636 [Chara braunii]